jgi:hypothetical protein
MCQSMHKDTVTSEKTSWYHPQELYGTTGTCETNVTVVVNRGKAITSTRRYFGRLRNRIFSLDLAMKLLDLETRII